MVLVEACFVVAQCSHCAFVVVDVILCCSGSTRWDLVLGAHDCASEPDIDEVLAKVVEVVELVEDGLPVLCITWWLPGSVWQRAKKPWYGSCLDLLMVVVRCRV